MRARLARREPESDEPAVDVELTEAAIPWPRSLDESGCRNVDWRTYRMAADRDAWRTLRDAPRPTPVSLAVLFPADMDRNRIPLRQFGVAVVDAATGEPLVACGCWRR